MSFIFIEFYRIMKMNGFKKLTFVGILGLALVNTAQAAIIDHGNYLTDTLTGLDWLDVTASVNMSLSQVTSNFGSGGLFEGWRLARGDEFNRLVEDFTGKAISGYGMILQEPDFIDGLVQMLGSTLDAEWVSVFGKTWDAYAGYSDGAGFDYVNGYIADTHDNQIYFARLLDYDLNDSVADFSMAHYALSDGYAKGDMGSYLVRDTQVSVVPEPSQMALLGVGALLMLRARYRGAV